MAVKESMSFPGELFQLVCIEEIYRSKSGSNFLLIVRKVGAMIMSLFKVY